MEFDLRNFSQLDMPVILRFSHKFALISIIMLVAIGALAIKTFDIFFDLRARADWQLRDAREGILNADFAARLMRASSNTAAFARTGSAQFRNEGEQALDEANQTLTQLTRLRHGEINAYGLETQHAALITRQREILSMAATRLTAVQREARYANLGNSRRVLTALHAYEPLADSLSQDIIAHRELEFAQDERELRATLDYMKLAVTGFLLLFLAIVTANWIFVRRVLLTPILGLAAAAKALAQGDFKQSVPITNRDEIGRLQCAFNQMVHNLSSRDALLNERNAELIRVVESERKGEKRLQLAMDGSNLSFWDLDIDSGVVYVNGRWRTTLGGNEKEIITAFETRLALVHPEDIAPCRMIMQRCRDGLVDTIDIECRVRDKGGNWVWAHTRGKVVQKDAAGRAIRMTGTLANISERKQGEQELQKSRDQLRNFAATLDATVEEERARIARELHDELGQVFTGLDMDLAWLAGEIQDAPAKFNAAAMLDQIGAMSRAIDGAITAVRRIATDLRPPLLDNLGLLAALEAQAAQFQQRTGIGYEVDFDPDLVVDRSRSMALFRICQEALTNIARHANATLVEIFLGRNDDMTLSFEVRDNGCGISAAHAANPHSVGLTGMRERARLVGAALVIRGRPNEGTIVRVEF